jgi:hypothetical protein
MSKYRYRSRVLFDKQTILRHQKEAKREHEYNALKSILMDPVTPPYIKLLSDESDLDPEVKKTLRNTAKDILFYVNTSTT